MQPDAMKTAKAEQTRARILDAALALFLEHGYDGTTMRAVAEAAGVSLGNAYYYFASKEALIQAFYGRTHEEHLAACAPILERETDFKQRLLGVMQAKLDTIAPYHRFAGKLFRTAAGPAESDEPVQRGVGAGEADRDLAHSAVAAGGDERSSVAHRGTWGSGGAPRLICPARQKSVRQALRFFRLSRFRRVRTMI